MSEQNLKEYINKKRSEGFNNDDIRQKLLDAGWAEAAITQVMRVDDDIPLPPNAQVQTQVTRTPLSHAEPKSNFWDAFEHIVMFISLYVFATSLGLILHYFVDKYVSSTTLNDYYNSYRSYSSYHDYFVTGYASGLIVSFPIFIFLFRRIALRTLNNPELRRGSARKKLTYLTLIGTFLILICQAIATVYTLLNGNITFNFFMHFLITCGITGAIFAYYFNEVKEDRKALEIV